MRLGNNIAIWALLNGLNATSGGSLISFQPLLAGDPKSYVRKLVTELSGGVFGYLDSVLERHSFDEFGELI